MIPPREKEAGIRVFRALFPNFDCMLESPGVFLEIILIILNNHIFIHLINIYLVPITSV